MHRPITTAQSSAYILFVPYRRDKSPKRASLDDEDNGSAHHPLSNISVENRKEESEVQGMLWRGKHKDQGS